MCPYSVKLCDCRSSMSKINLQHTIDEYVSSNSKVEHMSSLYEIWRGSQLAETLERQFSLPIYVLIIIRYTVIPTNKRHIFPWTRWVYPCELKYILACKQTLCHIYRVYNYETWFDCKKIAGKSIKRVGVCVCACQCSCWCSQDSWVDMDMFECV